MTGKHFTSTLQVNVAYLVSKTTGGF